MSTRQVGAAASRDSDLVSVADVRALVAYKGVGRSVSGDINPMSANSERSLGFAATQFDEGGFTSGISGDTICKVPAGLGGRYRLDMRYLVDNPTNSGGIALLVRINGSTYRELPLTVAAGAGTAIATTSDVLTLAAGDAFTATYYANASGMILRSSGTRTTQLLLSRLL